MSDRRRIYRAPVLVALGVVLLGAIALSQTSSSQPVPRAPHPEPLDGPSVPSARAISSAWYCAEGTSTTDGRATETVIVGNLERHPVDVELTVMPGGDKRLVTRRFRLDTLAQRRIPISSLVAAAEPGVVVEVFGGRAVVEHELTGRDDIAVGPCARQAARHWFFADGSTERGAEDWLALFNPFGDDAIVDVTFLTDQGVQSPDATQAVVVPRRSRISIPVQDLVRRQSQVGISVSVRTGRVIAEQSQRFDGTDTRKGLAVSLGVTGGANRWRLPAGSSASGATASVAIANFGVHPTKAEVRVVIDGDARLAPQDIDLAPSAVARVDVGSKVAAGTGYAVDVRSLKGVPIVVDSFAAWATPAPITGVASTPGSSTIARRWAFAVGRLDDAGDAVLSAWNVGSRPVTVQIYAYTAGDPNSPTSAPAIAVPPGKRGVFSLAEHGIRPDQVLVVEAEGPIVVGRQIQGGGESIAPGIPFTR